jgi:soluble lytic murein transglycosylase-like protein
MSKYNDIILSAAKEFNIDPKLINAFISVESGWNPNAIRNEPQINDTSYGLMQVLLGTGRRVSGNSSLTPEQLAFPTTNILIGTRYIRELVNRYNGVLDDVIAAYNAGSAIKSSSDPTKYINQSYVNKVKSAYSGVGVGLAMTMTIGVIGLAFIYSRTSRQ